MKRKVLLLEPNYKNKYPPIGLMKLATYHRMLGDDVTFYKGDLKYLLLDNLYDELLIKLEKINAQIDWNKSKKLIIDYIRTGRIIFLDELIEFTDSNIAIKNWFIYYKNVYRKKQIEKYPKWDRICITTLFTFHWKITIETIEFAKRIINTQNEIWIGGIMSSVIPKEVEKETGIKPWVGMLDKAGILDKKNKLIIDDLPLDYSILEEIDYKYSASNAYYGYMTRGCIRNCSFCAVPTLEPEFKHYIPIKQKIKQTQQEFGDQRNLLLLDNNVLASDKFSEIIDEIKSCGFSKDAKFVNPNYLKIAVVNLKEGCNDKAYIQQSFKIINSFINRLKGENQQLFYDLLEKYNLLDIETTTKEAIIEIYPQISALYDKYRNKAPKSRYVDFNQGIDARLINEDNMKLLSEININPLRIAFDSMKFERVYVKAVKLAAKNGINRLSNYLLYNETDKPIELYQRLKINVELCESENINIYSFPMKFHPINGNKKLNRNHLGKHWNRKFVRAIQTVLNATKGKIGKGQKFFYKAFGKDEDEFFKILYMPETFILFRYFFEDIGYTDLWWNEFNALSAIEKVEIKELIHQNDFKNINSLSSNQNILNVLKYYTITREDLKRETSTISKLKSEYYENNPITSAVFQ